MLASAGVLTQAFLAVKDQEYVGLQKGRLQNLLDYEETRDLAGAVAHREDALQQDRAHLNQLKQQEAEHRAASEATEQQLQEHVSLCDESPASV